MATCSGRSEGPVNRCDLGLRRRLRLSLRDRLVELDPIAVAIPNPGEQSVALVELWGNAIGVDVQTTVTIAPDLSTRWIWNVQRAPMVLDVALSCRGDQAIASVAGPAWASIQLDSIVQRADICIVPTPVAKNPFGFRLPSIPVGTVLVLAGVLIGAL